METTRLKAYHAYETVKTAAEDDLHFEGGTIKHDDTPDGGIWVFKKKTFSEKGRYRTEFYSVPYGPQTFIVPIILIGIVIGATFGYTDRLREYSLGPNGI